MYKVTCEVISAESTPHRIPGVKGDGSSCPLYRVGDRITLVGNPLRVLREETDAVCLFALGSIIAASQ